MCKGNSEKRAKLELALLNFDSVLKLNENF